VIITQKLLQEHCKQKKVRYIRNTVKTSKTVVKSSKMKAAARFGKFSRVFPEP